MELEERHNLYVRTPPTVSFCFAFAKAKRNKTVVGGEFADADRLVNEAATIYVALCAP